ncbi:MAG: methyltransferase domain-containing protein, partial [Ardenticatenales bacterium]
ATDVEPSSVAPSPVAPSSVAPPSVAPPSVGPSPVLLMPVVSSPVATAFDALAARYDEHFTEHPAGRIVREAVWRVTDARFGAGDRVLDLGCGTGADAVHLAERGCDVVALDASPAMVQRTRAAAAAAGPAVDRRVRAAVADIADGAGWAAADAAEEVVDGVDGGMRDCGGRAFDGALSDFGVLNCIEDLGPLGDALAARMAPGGRFVAVVMARFCAWETAAGVLGGDRRRATRRWSGRAMADLGTGPWPVWYRTPGAIVRGLGPSWSLVRSVPIGAVVPPTWAVRAGGRFDRPWLWRAWSVLEAVARRVPTASGWADHVLLDLVRVPPPGAHSPSADVHPPGADALRAEAHRPSPGTSTSSHGPSKSGR